MGERNLVRIAVRTGFLGMLLLMFGCGAYLIGEPKEYEEELEAKFTRGSAVKDLERHLTKQGFQSRRPFKRSQMDCLGKTFQAFPVATIWRFVCIDADDDQNISGIEVIQYGAGL